MDHLTTFATPSVRRGSEVQGDAAVSVIVLVTADTGRLRRCLDSINANRPEHRPIEVLVVANGTPETELAWLETREDIVLLTSPVNLGFGGGCNWAGRVARGERLLFVNDDAVTTPGWLEALDRALDDDRHVGVAGSRVLLSTGALQEAGAVIWRDGTTSGVGRGRDPSLAAYAVSRDVDYVSFCSAMVRRPVWDAVAGFDESFFPAYYEDTDLCLSARMLGWRVICEPRSVVVHEEGRSSSTHYSTFLKRRNRERFLARWGPTIADHEPPPSLTAGQMAVTRALERSARAVTPTVDPGVVGRRARQRADDAAARGSAPAADGTPATAAQVLRVVALQREYIDHLSGELATTGLAALAGRRYRNLRARTGALLTRHPRLGNLVRSVIVSVGNRD
jgi:GT2 family glycosyltransferase